MHPSWWILHPAAPWLLAGLLGMAAGCVAALVRLRAVAARRAEEALRALGPVAGGLSDGATVTLEGTLDVAGWLQQEPGETHARLTGEPRTRVERQDPWLWLDQDCVTLAGPLDLRTGSQESWGDQGPGAGSGTPRRALLGGRRVRARGTLRLRPAEGVGHAYREAPSRWTLVPPPDSDAIALCAVSRPRSDDQGVVLVGLAGAVASLLVAAVALEGAWLALGVGMPRDPSEVTSERHERALKVASVLPWRRPEALRALEQRARRRSSDEPSAAAMEARLAYTALRSDCAHTVDALLEHGQLDRAAYHARRCRLHHREAVTQYAQGAYTHASLALLRARDQRPPPDLHFSLQVHLLARHWEDAARTVEALQDASSRLLLAEPEGLRVARRRQRACLAAALRVRAGGPVNAYGGVAWELLRSGAWTGDGACSALLADLYAPGSAERAEALACWRPEGLRETALRRLLLAEGRAEGEAITDLSQDFAVLQRPSLLIQAPERALEGMLPGLEDSVLRGILGLQGDGAAIPEERWALTGHDATAVLRCRLGLRRAVFLSVASEHREALATARGALSCCAALAEDESARALDLAALVGVRARSPAFQPSAAVGGDHEAVRRVWGWAWNNDDAFEFRATVRRLGRSGLSDETLPDSWHAARSTALVVSLGLGLDAQELGRWSQYAPIERALDRGPLTRLAAVSNRLLLAGPAGNHALVASLRATQLRQAEALSAREVMVPLWLAGGF